MVATAAHLTDHVFPRLPVRQWVLAAPKRLRYFLQHDTAAQGAALRLFLRAVEQRLRAHSPGARTSAASARWPSSTVSGRRSMPTCTSTAWSSRGLAPHSPLRAAVIALAVPAATAPAAPPPHPAGPAAEPAHRRAARYAWALLLARIYAVSPLRCPTSAISRIKRRIELRVDRDRGGGPSAYRLTNETGRYLALWMSYEDLIRVAELKTRPARLTRLRAEVDAKPASRWW